MYPRKVIALGKLEDYKLFFKIEKCLIKIKSPNHIKVESIKQKKVIVLEKPKVLKEKIIH